MSSSAHDLLPQVSLGNTFGALLIGVTLAAFLFGLTNLQAFIYFQTHNKTDIPLYKLVVLWLWIFDALHLALLIHCVYYYLVTNYANFGALTEIVWSFKLQVLVNVLIVPVVHFSYIHRIWILSKGRSRVLPATAFGILVVICSGVSIPVVWAIYRCDLFEDLAGIEWWTYGVVGSAAFADILIASSLCYLLVTSRTGFSRTDSLLVKLVVYIVSTGSVTSVCLIMVIIACALLPKTFVFLAIDFLAPKLYVNSFIALLNARHYVQDNADVVKSSEIHIRHAIYPKLRIGGAQDPGLQVSRKDSGDDVLHLTHPI